MQGEIHYRRHTDAQDALIVAWVLILGVVGILYFVAWDKLHVRASQLIELTIYPFLAFLFLWEALRYRATRTRTMEEAWPRPIPYVPREQEERHIEEARRQSSVLLGYRWHFSWEIR